MRTVSKNLFYLVLVLFFYGCNGFNAKAQNKTDGKQLADARPDAFWKKKLSPEAFQIMVEKGTEPAYKNPYYDNHKEGIYVSAATGKPLFSSKDKFDSGTGWPSFSQPMADADVLWQKDNSHGMVRDEVVERSTGLHLGHVFHDGPAPTHLRYCINSAALKFVPAGSQMKTDMADNSHATGTMAQNGSPAKTGTAYFASGCFWCTEAIFESLKGVDEVISGYAGGYTKNPTYEDSNTGKTGHAEAVEVIYDPSVIDFATLIDVYFGSQDPTQANGQGPDHGSQYRSIIFYQNAAEKKIIDEKKAALAKESKEPIAAEVTPFEKFWKAEAYHQGYERKHPENPYIQSVSIPRIERFEKKFPKLLKSSEGVH